MGAFIHFTAMSVERNTQVSTASMPVGSFRGSLVTHVGFHGEHFSSSGSLRFTCDVCRMARRGFHARPFSSRIFAWEPSLHSAIKDSAAFFHGSLHFACGVSGASTATASAAGYFHGSLRFTCDVYTSLYATKGFHAEHFSSKTFPGSLFTSRTNMFGIKVARHVGIRRRYSTNTHAKNNLNDRPPNQALLRSAGCMDSCLPKTRRRSPQ